MSQVHEGKKVLLLLDLTKVEKGVLVVLDALLKVGSELLGKVDYLISLLLRQTEDRLDSVIATLVAQGQQHCDARHDEVHVLPVFYQTLPQVAYQLPHLHLVARQLIVLFQQHHQDLQRGYLRGQVLRLQQNLLN